MATPQEIADKVKAIIVQHLGVNDADLKLDSSFIEDMGADSLDIVELVMELEEEFGLTIPDEDAEKMQTVGDAVTYIQSKSV